MLEHAAELVQIGTRIVELGSDLEEARAAKAKADARVAELESELRPLLRQHATIVAKAAGGVTFASPEVAQPQQTFVLQGPSALPNETSLAGAGTPAAAPANVQLKNRVKDYLKNRNAEEGVSAGEVADHLKIDPLVVREAMLELKHGR